MWIFDVGRQRTQCGQKLIFFMAGTCCEMTNWLTTSLVLPLRRFALCLKVVVLCHYSAQLTHCPLDLPQEVMDKIKSTQETVQLWEGGEGDS